MSGAPTLRRTQELFWRLITAPEGVRAGVEAFSREGIMNRGELEDLFQGRRTGEDAGLPAIDRLDIYANMYFYRLLDALKEDYPRVRQAIGEQRFHNLVTDYLLAHPSGHPSLRFLGEKLPGFIADHALARLLPYLCDLARLEWDRVEMFDAPDARPLSRDDLARLPQDRAGEARFTVVPACRLRRFDHDVARIWRELKDDERNGRDPGRPEDGRTHRPSGRPTWLRIWRREFVVYHRSIDEDEARSLEQLRAGEPLERLCQQLAAGRSPQQATERIGALLQSWLDEGLLAAFNLPAV